MQRTRGLVKGEVRLSGARRDKLDEVMKVLSRTVRITHGPFIDAGTCNRNSLTVSVAYGPVWGGWESDVRKRFHEAIARVGSSARLSYDNLQRIVVERR